MAVHKSRVTRSKRDMRRNHDKLTNATLSIDPTTGECHRRHHVTAEGYYRGKQVLQIQKEEVNPEGTAEAE